MDVGGFVGVVRGVIIIKMALMKIHKKLHITVSGMYFHLPHCDTTLGAMETINILELYIFCNYKIDKVLDP